MKPVRFEPTSLVDRPFVVVKTSGLTREWGINAFVVTEANANDHKVYVDVNLPPHIQIAALAHEIAHIRYKSYLSYDARRLAMNRWGHRLSSAFLALCRTAEDVRVEYQLMTEFPGTVPLIAALRTRRVLVARKETHDPDGTEDALVQALQSAFWIMRCGYDEPGWLYNFIAPRLVLLARSRNSMDSVAFANMLLAYIVQRLGVNQRTFVQADVVDSFYPVSVPEKGGRESSRRAKLTADSPDEHVDSRIEHDQGRDQDQDDEEEAEGPGQDSPSDLEDGEGSQPDPEVGPWGAMSPGAMWSMERKASMSYSASDVAEIVDKQLLMRGWWHQYAKEVRRDQIRRISELLGQVSVRGMSPSYEGDLSVRRQTDAYVASISGDETRAFLKRRIHPPGLDLMVVVDVSGSMSGVAENVCLDVLSVLIGAHTHPDVRSAVVWVSDNVEVRKTLRDSVDYKAVYPCAEGGTNFHVFFQKWDDVVARTGFFGEKRVMLIVTDGWWPWQKVRVSCPGVLVLPVVYAGAQLLPENVQSECMRHFGLYFTDVVSAFEHAVRRLGVQV